MPTFKFETRIEIDDLGKEKLAAALRPFSAYLLDGITALSGGGSSMGVFYPHTVNQRILFENLSTTLSPYLPVKEEPQGVVK